MKDITNIKLDPHAHYGHPSDVLKDSELSREQKIEILRAWRYDAQRLQDSADENMTGGEADHLQAVSNALLHLGVSPAEEEDHHAPPEQSGWSRSIERARQHLSNAIARLRGGGQSGHP